ncbi:MAG TPA: carboxypeptidase-like regulatory domain-containing protein [Pyrinomonadaceae bacterium]|nr:carboxypeptidase-like regulatory domain-containing protein [Pyrinomonadaceae bacterium]
MVSGPISAANSSGIRNVFVSLTDSDRNTRTVRTGAFGYYRFDEVEVGGMYIISVRAKRFTFAQSLQVLNVGEVLANVDFVAGE